MTDPERPRDIAAEFIRLIGVEQDVDPNFGRDQMVTEDPAAELVSLLRRTEFLTVFMELYGDEPDVPGYSHRRTLRQAEGYSEADIPTEEMAILKRASSINGFVDKVLSAADDLTASRDALAPAMFENDCSATKLVFASEAWSSYEPVALWLTRLIDAAILDGNQTSNLSQDDIDTYSYLLTGRTASRLLEYDGIINQIGDNFPIIFGEQFAEAFSDMIDVESLQYFVVEWAATEAIYKYETRSDSGLTTQALGYLERLHEHTVAELGERLNIISVAELRSPQTLIDRLEPYIKSVFDVTLIGLHSLDMVDDVDLPPEQQSIIDTWFMSVDTDDPED